MEAVSGAGGVALAWVVGHGGGGGVGEGLGSRYDDASLRGLFVSLDTDGSGSIDADEFRQAMAMMGVKVHPLSTPLALDIAWRPCPCWAST